WQGLIDQQEGMLALAADDLLQDAWLAHLLDSGNQGLLAIRLQESLPRLERRYGVTGVEISNPQGEVIYPPGQATAQPASLEAVSQPEPEQASREAVIGFRQNLNRDFVLSYSEPLPAGGRLMLTTT